MTLTTADRALKEHMATTSEPRVEAAALAFMAAIGCGYERRLCDDPEAPASIRKRECGCRQAARAVLLAADAAFPGSGVTELLREIEPALTDALTDVENDPQHDPSVVVNLEQLRHRVAQALRGAPATGAKPKIPGSGGEWRPIETARKVINGERVRLRFGSEIECTGQYRYGRPSEPQRDVLDWRCDCCGRFGGAQEWQPLPAPPGSSPSPSVTEEEIARAICCPGTCLRGHDDCWAGRQRHEKEQARAVMALIRGDAR